MDKCDVGVDSNELGLSDQTMFIFRHLPDAMGASLRNCSACAVALQ